MDRRSAHTDPQRWSPVRDSPSRPPRRERAPPQHRIAPSVVPPPKGRSLAHSPWRMREWSVAGSLRLDPRRARLVWDVRAGRSAPHRRALRDRWGRATPPDRPLPRMRTTAFPRATLLSFLWRRGVLDTRAGPARTPRTLPRGPRAAAGLPRRGAIWLRDRRARRRPVRRLPPHRASPRTPAPGSSRPARRDARRHRRGRHSALVLGLRPRGERVMRPVYVAGVGIHPFGRFADLTVTTLGARAVRAALA